ncbi:membrane protein [Mycolicibacterium madagascariense]|uniref:Membrane protein n=1 Tax=Mycolicibacterium madagascariense TaxID=212765 RepID=A0A7I7XNM7_9MYCO|nr:DUF4129 domain-containing protein [Mycolicibacterium madagascariense]MCV7015095.1 DUF4129 domain-containing protein [Mycolicibacterium madagascariense]BBZ30683.1 membrane protein [Mycolicibacterium madagascariense]
MATIDIDREAAHDAAQHELSKSIYPHGSLPSLVLQWLDDVLARLVSRAASVPGGWLTIIVLLLLLTVAAVAAIRITRRTMRTRRGHQDALFGTTEMSSTQHRSAAEHAAAEGDWAAAIRHRVRGIARHLEETGVLLPIPGRTASELARDAGRELPGLALELHGAATSFNDVTYGELPGTEPGYRLVAALDDHVCAHAAGSAPDDAARATRDGWAEVR